MFWCPEILQFAQPIKYASDFSLYAVNSEFTEQGHGDSDPRRELVLLINLAAFVFYERKARTRSLSVSAGGAGAARDRRRQLSNRV